MSYVISFFRNKWTKIGFSALSLGYGFFVIWLAWLTFTYHLVPTNPVSLFSLYLMINVMFGVVMIYTRKQIATQIVACLLHPCILVMLIFAYGNLFLLIPVFAISTVVFFAAGSPESLKTILGTIYLILFVLTILGYLTLQAFSITDNIFSVNLDLRNERYIHSEDETYRLVMYIDKDNKEHRMVNFVVEFTGDDLSLPFLNGEKYAGSTHILRQRLTRSFEIEWNNENKLTIILYTEQLDGEPVREELIVEWLSDTVLVVGDDVRNAPDFEKPDRINDDTFANETEIFIPPPTMTVGTTTPPPANE